MNYGENRYSDRVGIARQNAEFRIELRDEPPTINELLSLVAGSFASMRGKRYNDTTAEIEGRFMAYFERLQQEIRSS